MKIKEKDIKLFLEKCGWASATSTPIAGDASFRSYRRLNKENTSAVLMLAPPKKEDTAHFIALAKYLLANGFSAPTIKAMDPDIGLLLLEDFGDKLLSKMTKSDPEREQECYCLAVELLATLQKQKPPQELATTGGEFHTLPRYDGSLLMKEVNLFLNWYMKKGLRLGDNIDEEKWTSLWTSLFKKIGEPRVLTLRDYHAENIIMLLDRKYIKRIGLLDFQDAVIGHNAYDLVSLLQDARREVSPELEEKMIQHFLTSIYQKGVRVDEASFLTEYNILGAQRNAKIIGIFTRLWLRDGKKQYAKLIPHVWNLLERNLKHPSLKPLRTWLDNTIPEEQRRQPLKGL